MDKISPNHSTPWIKSIQGKYVLVSSLQNAWIQIGFGYNRSAIVWVTHTKISPIRNLISTPKMVLWFLQPISLKNAGIAAEVFVGIVHSLPNTLHTANNWKKKSPPPCQKYNNPKCARINPLRMVKSWVLSSHDWIDLCCRVKMEYQILSKSHGLAEMGLETALSAQTNFCFKYKHDNRAGYCGWRSLHFGRFRNTLIDFICIGAIPRKYRPHFIAIRLYPKFCEKLMANLFYLWLLSRIMCCNFRLWF